MELPQYNHIILEIQKKVATITLNRPQKRNALSVDMITEIADATHWCNTQNSVLEVIVLRANTDQAPVFSAGIDLKDLAMRIQQLSEEDLPGFVKQVQDHYTTITTSRLPTIAVIDGMCLGAGLELALACDFRIGTPRSQLALNETRFGMIPDLGGTTQLIRLLGSQVAKRVIMLAQTLDAQTSLDLGLLDWLEEDIESRLDKIISQLTSNSAMAVQRAKQLINTSTDLSGQESLRADMTAQLELIRSGEVAERVNGFLRKQD